MAATQATIGGGPQVAALEDLATVYVPDLQHERRWPVHMQAAAARGFRCVLVVPVLLDDPANGLLTLYGTMPSALASADLARFEAFASQASKSLRLAMRIAGLQVSRKNLRAALDLRTVIGLAAGGGHGAKPVPPGRGDQNSP